MNNKLFFSGFETRVGVDVVSFEARTNFAVVVSGLVFDGGIMVGVVFLVSRSDVSDHR